MLKEDINQEKFMLASGQTTSGFNHSQAMLYAKLVEEESGEFLKAAKYVDKGAGLDALVLTEMIDGAADLIVVAKGFLYSLGIHPEDVMGEVWASNLSKVDNKTDRVLKREDGKVLKPEGWKPPNFAQFNPLLK